MAAVPVGALVFLDEAGFSLNMSRLYGWSQSNARCVECAPFQRGKNRSVLGAFCVSSMVAFVAREGAFKRDAVEAFFETTLLPALPAGSVLVLDNARIHHGGRIAELVAGAGCSLLYLPPYSPDFSPIEPAWGYVKGLVRGDAPRTDETRDASITKAMTAIPEKCARGWFKHCGYETRGNNQ